MASNPPNSNSDGSRGFPVALPPRASPEARKMAIVEVIRSTGLPPRQAAMSVGVSSSAYYRLAEDPEFVAEMDSATSVFARRMAAVIARAAASLGSWKAAAFWLERRMGEYGVRSTMDVIVAGQTGLESLSDEELHERLDALRSRTDRHGETS